MKYVFTILAILIMLLLFYGIPTTDKNIREAFLKFDSAELNGKLESIDIKYHRDCIKLTDSNEEYVFSSYPLYDGTKSFAVLAKKGDTIIKRPKSDTLLLTKEGKGYLFLIKREQ